MAEGSMEKETIPYKSEEGTEKSGDELHSIDIIQIDVITQTERGSENNIIPQAMFSEKPKPERSGAWGNSAASCEGRPVPIYLRASTSSCHDSCKYGREHSFPNREKRRPTRALIKVNKESKVDVQTEIKKLTISEWKKKQAIKAEASSSPKLIAQPSSSTKVIKQKAITPAKKIEITVKPTISSNSKLKPPVSKTSPSPSNPAVGLAKRNSSSTISLNRLRRLSSLRKNHINPVNRPNSLGGLSGRDASNHSENSNGRRRSDGMLTRSRGLSTPVERRMPRSSLTTLTPKPSSNGAAQLNLLNYQKMKKPSPESSQTTVRTSKPKEEKVSMKTLYVIESNSKRKSSTSSRQSHSSLSSAPSPSSHDNEDILDSESRISEAGGSVSEQEDTETSASDEVSEDGAQRIGRRSKLVHPEDKDEAEQKLSFRRGRVVSLQTENNIPRKLRFRQGRVTGENQNGKSDPGRRSFRRKKELGALELDKPNAGAESVVLRHQDVQGRKEELGLFNEVIEETASKLVETRKSKVKALVGAFETVISLQESKPATST